MASVFKREGAGLANKWYAQIKIGKAWKVIRLSACYSGEGAISKDRALHLALESEMMANKALGVEVNEAIIHDFTKRVLNLTKDDTLLETTSDYLRRWLKESEGKVLLNKLASGTLKGRKAVVKVYLDHIGGA